MRRWLWLLILLAWVGVSQAQGPRVVIVKATTGAVIADLVVTTTSQQVVAFSGTRMGIICWNQGASPNAIRIGFGATPTATSGYFLLWGSGFTDDGTYTINAIRDTGATANPTLSCSTGESMRRSPAWMILGWVLFLATLVWAQPRGFGPFTGGGGLPSGAVYLIVTGTCPAGSSEVSALDGQMLRATLAGNADVGTTGGLGTITPLGTVTQPTLSMTAFTPQGTTGSPAFVGSAGTVAAQTITWPIGVPTFVGDALATHVHNFSGAVLATHTHNFSGAVLATHRHEEPFQLVSGTLLRFLGGGTFGVGTVRAAIGQITATANTTSTAVALSQAITAGTPAGTNSSVTGGTPAGTNSSVTGGTPAGTNSWPAGVPTAGSVNFTPAGTVSAPVFTGSQATLTGTVTQPSFSGSGFDPHPPFTRVIFCQVT